MCWKGQIRFFWELLRSIGLNEDIISYREFACASIHKLRNKLTLANSMLDERMTITWQCASNSKQLYKSFPTMAKCIRFGSDSLTTTTSEHEHTKLKWSIEVQYKSNWVRYLWNCTSSVLPMSLCTLSTPLYWDDRPQSPSLSCKIWNGFANWIK